MWHIPKDNIAEGVALLIQAFLLDGLILNLIVDQDKKEKTMNLGFLELNFYMEQLGHLTFLFNTKIIEA